MQDYRMLSSQVPKFIVTDDPGTLYKLSEKAGQYDLRVQGLYELLASHLI